MRYPPISDYALISDCRCNALISRYGSVDWSCMPRIDEDSSFGRLLDWDKGGHCSIAPADENYTSSWRYIDCTMVLETTFRTNDGEVRLTDFLAVDTEEPGRPHYDHVRLVDGVSGEVDMEIEICPRFDYGAIVPYTEKHASGLYTAIGSNQGLIIYSDTPLDVIEHRDLAGKVRIRAGERIRLAIRFEFPEAIEQALKQKVVEVGDLDCYFEETTKWWSDWAARARCNHPLDAQTMRSAVVLKALTYEQTGAIVAASTASLPEWIGGVRNWDYRFSWVRDSMFTIRSLHDLGYDREAERFHHFIQRSSAGDADQLQIMYGVDGKRRLTEVELEWMEGYRQSRPVRIGNAAAKQGQHDIYGELLEMAWEWHCRGRETDLRYWHFLADVVELVCRVWNKPDHGIWEVRCDPLHHVHSKVMCWAAVNRGIQLAQALNFDVPLERWIAAREEIRAVIEDKGYDKERGVFVQAFGSREMDAALLILPRVDFVAYTDPRMLRTVDAICEDLDRGGLLLRYRGSDGLPGSEGMFLPCTFWLVACLAYQGKIERARQYYERALACSNELGLFSEEYDTESKQMLGNYPQGLTHVSQIMAWLALHSAQQPAQTADSCPAT